MTNPTPPVIMDNDTLCSPHNSAMTDSAFYSRQPPLSCVCNGNQPSPRQYRPRRRQPHGGFNAVLLTAATLSYCQLHAMAMHNNNGQQQQNDSPTTTHRRLDSAPCTQNQHTLLFTLFTDSHSIKDNSWTVSHASYGAGLETGNSGQFIVEESLDSGNLGYGAVVPHTICVDRAPQLSPALVAEDNGRTIDSCYDVELSDLIGDGLTAPWASTAGLAGGFSLSIDNKVAVEHRGQACLADSDDEWNACAAENGFEFCGVRVCTVSDNGVPKATVSNLSGSQCSLIQPQCDASSNYAVSESSIAINVDTDSYAEELSWDLRKSTKADSKQISAILNNDLILAGGNVVYQDDSMETVMIGQPGVGVALDDNESYESKACLPDDQSDDTCYDFRAYDTYGDGMGCGGRGLLSITLKSERGTLIMEQKDKNMAKRRRVDGRFRLACMNQERLAKWSYCAVRICHDGEVFGLEGNECEFSLGDDLLDEEEVEADGDPNSPNMNPQSSAIQVQIDDKADEVDPMKPNAVDISAFIDGNDLDQTWAEYYDILGPGFKDVDNGIQTYTAESSLLNDASKPNKNQGQKGPKPGKKNPNPLNEQVSNVFQPLKRFFTDLLPVSSPYSFKDDSDDDMADEVSDYLVSYFDDHDKIDAAPIKFELDCTKAAKNDGRETRWVMKCSGTAVFWNPSPAGVPTKKVVNNIIRAAFLVEPKEDFLRRIYDFDMEQNADKQGNTKKNKKQLKKEKMEARKEMLEQKQMKNQTLQQKLSLANIGHVFNKNQLKKKQKQDWIKAKKQQHQKNQMQQQLKRDEPVENLMGYVSGFMSETVGDNSNKGFTVIGENIENINVYLDVNERGGRKRKRMLRSFS